VSQDDGRQSVFQLGYSKTDNRWALSHPLTGTDNAAVAKALAAVAPQSGVWTHLVGVHDLGRKELRIYVNGRLEGTATYTARSWGAQGPFTIGRGQVNGVATGYWPGQLDDVAAYERVLNDEEIAGLAATTGYVYQLDGQEATEVAATGPAKVMITPEHNGAATLIVRARNSAGVLSAPTTYRFRVGTSGPPDPPTELATEPAATCRTGADRPHLASMTPRLGALVDDPDYDELTTTFEWWELDGAKVGEATTTNWAGATATVSVPAGALVEDGVYAWRARSADATAAGPWSGWCEFTVDTE
jgi:hypothetical protein